MDNKRLFLVDAYALIYRSYYAFLTRPMRSPEGVNTSPVFGFVKFLRDLIKRERPHYLGVAFDSKGPTFRHEMYGEYKANRDAAPEDIHLAVPYIKRILEAMRIPVLEMAGWEADDIIGTLSCRGEQQGFDVYMVTPDKDFGQLVRDHVFIYKQNKGGDGITVIKPADIYENYGLDDPRHIIDVLALWGDASDNIPGVPGIGEKTAVKLVCQFGTVEEILENIDQIKGKQKENILAHRQQLMLSKTLATIDTDAPVPFDPSQLVMENPDVLALHGVFLELGFNMFIREMEAGKFLPDMTLPAGISSGSTSGGDDMEDAESKPMHPKSPTRNLRKRPADNSMQGSLFGAASSQIPTGETEDERTVVFDIQDGYGNIDTVPHDYRTASTAEQVREIVEDIRKKGEFCFDTETSGFNIYSCKLCGISVSTEPGKAWYVSLAGDNRKELLEILEPVFSDPDIAKTGQNIKFDIMALRVAGIETRGFKYGTMLLHYLLDPEARHGMSYLSRLYLDYEPVEIEKLIGKGTKQITMDMVPPEKIAIYAAEDADVTLRLKEVLWKKVQEENLEKLYRDIEEPMIDVLAGIEAAGVKIDTEILAEAGRELNRKLAGMEDRIRELTGEPGLNVNSAKQLGEALFGKMKIDPKPKTTKTKQYRTDEEYLQSLSDKSPVIGLILEYRGIKKLLSTYIEALPQLVDPVTGRVHTSYNQAVTATGRLSSSNPNLQNIPIRDEQGREIRKAFVPADKDHLLLSADYSQVELRLMAHLSEDNNLMEAFNKKEDVHAATASLLFNVPLPEVTSDQRRKAKTANFGIIYGISAFGLGQRLNIPRGEAKEIIDGYFRSYPGVREYMERVIEQARGQGYVTTIFGRKRKLPDIRSANAVARGLAERNAINAPIQGSAADIIKIAMIQVHREFQKRRLRSRMIMQVHDELVIDLYKPERDQVVDILTSAMENAAKLKVDLVVDYGIGQNWVEAH
ncbi:MAG: DNA polymerase I [Rikenellaceae bacterium]|nr:DNA polymerase I [Rikenellaceae bacterium]